MRQDIGSFMWLWVHIEDTLIQNPRLRSRHKAVHDALISKRQKVLDLLAQELALDEKEIWKLRYSTEMPPRAYEAYKDLRDYLDAMRPH